MNAAILDFPPIEAPPLAAAPAPAPVAVVPPVAALPLALTETVLAQFAVAEKAVVALAEKYRAVAFDVSTTKGMTEAKAARQDLRENGRFLVQRAEKSVKEDVNSLKKVMADEVERIVAIVKPVEDAVDAQIKAEEERKAAAKAERERIETERVAAHQAGIAKIRAYLAHCQNHCQKPDMTAERIGTGIAMLEKVTFGPEWQEFAEQAKVAQAETLTAMRELQAAAAEREAAAAEAQRQAEENARVAAELAERERALKAQEDALAEQRRQAAAEAARVSGLQARVAAIHARPLALEGARAWDIFQAIVELEDMDVSEAVFAEFAPMAADARRLVLAALLKAKDDAEAREAAVVAETSPATVRSFGGGMRRREAAPVPVAIPEAAAEIEPDDGAPIVADEPADVESDSTRDGVDLFGAAPAQAPAVVALTDCQEALREALQMVQELVNGSDQSTTVKAFTAREILSRVAELRALGGI